MRPEFSPPENSWMDNVRKQRAADIEERLYREHLRADRPAARLSQWLVDRVKTARHTIQSAHQHTEAGPVINLQSEQTAR